MIYAQPGTPGAVVSFKPRYGNFIGGKFVEPVNGQYFTNTSPVNGKRSPSSRAPCAGYRRGAGCRPRAADAWGKTCAQDRSLLLLKIADRIEPNLEFLAVTESWDNGKPVRETLNADLPLAVDHFRYFAGACAPRKAAPPKSMKKPWPIISMSRWAWSGRLSRGTSRC